VVGALRLILKPICQRPVHSKGVPVMSRAGARKKHGGVGHLLGLSQAAPRVLG
jgi:hypothetical protein